MIFSCATNAQFSKNFYVPRKFAKNSYFHKNLLGGHHLFKKKNKKKKKKEKNSWPCNSLAAFITGDQCGIL